jgi:hypothetical protein
MRYGRSDPGKIKVVPTLELDGEGEQVAGLFAGLDRRFF